MPLVASRPAELNRLLSTARLPALSQSAIRVMEMTRDSANGPAELAVVIEVDPGLASQVLKFLNSSYFGFSQKIVSVQLAIAMVGVRTIRNYVLWCAVFSALPNPKCGPFSLKVMRQDSLRRGLFARRLGKTLGMADAEEAFTAALLADMAVPVLAKAMPAEYVELLAERADGRRRLAELEQQRFGWNHAQVAGMMARQWRFPAALVAAIEGHAQARPSQDQLARVTQLAALLPSNADSAWHEFAPFKQAYQALIPGRQPTIHELFKQTDADYAELAPALKLEAVRRPLVDDLRKAVDASA